LRWIRSAAAIFAREMRGEWRTRGSVGSTLLFAVCMLAAISFVLAYKVVEPDVKAALLWVLLLFTAVTGLARVYAREEEIGTADALRLAAPATAVHAGKLLFNGLLLGTVQVASTVLFLNVLPPGAGFDTRLFALVSILGGIGLTTTTTFAAALVAQASASGARGALLFIISFPVLLPVLLPAAAGTVAAFAPQSVSPGTAHNCVVLLTSYDIAITAAALGMIGTVWGGSA
jgi:heme exporter protein B